MGRSNKDIPTERYTYSIIILITLRYSTKKGDKGSKLVITIHLGVKPRRGGIPPSDSKVIRAGIPGFIVRAPELVERCVSVITRRVRTE